MCSVASGEPTPITSAVQLFVDDYLVETTEGIRRTVHQWQKHPDNPVLRADNPWESRGKSIFTINLLSTYGSVIYDQQEDIFKAWYFSRYKEEGKRHSDHFMCYATSVDGIHWEKPNVGLYEFQGSKDNNIVLGGHMEGFGGKPHTFGAIKTPWDPDPDRLYKACFYDRPPGVGYQSPEDGARSATSPDGIHWTTSGAVIMPTMGDTIGFFYDSIHDRYVCFAKRYTDRGRSRFQCESEDFVNWTEPRLIMETDDEDDQPCDLYNNTGFVWGDMLLGWLQVFYDHQDPYKSRLVLELMHSRDGENWSRMPNRETVLDVGPDGSFDRTNQAPATDTPIVVGDRMYMYYSGRTDYHSRNQVPGRWDTVKRDWSGEHYVGNQRLVNGNIGLGTLRLDGFVSMDANPLGGVLTTKPLLITPGQPEGVPIRLHVNVKSDWGHCQVELLDEAGNPIPGYTKDDADDIVADTVDTVVTWHGEGDISELVRQPVRLRFHLQNARLYSFRMSP